MEVSRSALRSQTPSPPTSPEIDREHVLAQLQNLDYDLPTSQITNEQDRITGATPQESNEHDAEDDEGLEFRLFAPTTKPTASSNKNQTDKNQTQTQIQTTRIRLDSPTEENRAPGFLNPHRNRAYYFATPPSPETQKTLDIIALSPTQIHNLSKIPWPGVSYPWKVLHLPATNSSPQTPQPKTFAKLGLQAEVSKKRTRLSKACRIRKRKALAMARDEQARVREVKEAKEVAEREKRTRRNREKKIKKRAKEKAAKGGGGGEGDGEVKGESSGEEGEEGAE
ncbi:hypothetical protein MBLNU230_g7061t1 [Neophaeotheca triangularis]